MNVGNRRLELKEQRNSYNATLSMYNEPPTVEVSLEQFEEYAIDRLHVLKAVENYRLRTAMAKDKETRLDKQINKYMPLRAGGGSLVKRAESDTTKDILSHFFLRMVFCQNEELRRWFLSQESVLFRYRLDKMTREEKIYFMKQNGISFEEATSKEIEIRQKALKAVRDAQVTDKERFLPLPAFFKVPFTDALDLVSTRRVYVERGIAYVPFDHVVSLLAAAFRTNLSKQLASAFRKYNRSLVSKDERLAPILSNLAKHHIDAEYNVQANHGVIGDQHHITPAMIDSLAPTSMPLCMRSLHKALQINHHLKFAGRQQFGLFLKGTGLSLDDAIAYWRQAFCTKMSVDDFNKKYAYNIRHNYGKEGKRKDYIPPNCMRIITGEPPKAGEYHGCPFRHYEQEHLRKALNGIKENEKQEILGLVQGRHYQIACKKYFEATHVGSDPDIMITHPNGYFDESRKYYTAKQNEENGSMKG